MKKILAFSGSNSSTSINQQLVALASTRFEHAEVTLINLRDYVLPMYSIDREKTEGIPAEARELKALFDAHDGFLIAVAEHNLSMTAFFKNVLDWLSRIHMSFFDNKPVALLSTSPGPGGGRSALAHVKNVVSGYLSARVVSELFIPGFHQAFERVNGAGLQLRDELLAEDLKKSLASLEGAIHQSVSLKK